MKEAKIQFSVIIPTYTGQDHIIDCFDSIIAQDDLSDFDFNVIVVIDGPNSALRNIVDSQSQKFRNKNIGYSTYQFKENKGRFKARQKGATESKSKYLLFLDDRNILAHDYFNVVLGAKKDALIPNVLENNHPHFIAKTMYFIRKKIYGNKWGNDFISYEINKYNFENSSKGTTSFWVKRDVFMKACGEISKRYSDLKTVSDDTKLLKYIVDDDVSIYRSSEAKIYYQPRKSVKAEIKHIFHRGPVFIDYYLRPGTRFFVPLVLFYLSILISLFLIFIGPLLFLALILIGLVATLLASFYIVGFSAYAFLVFAGLIIIAISFGIGLVKGLILKLAHPSRVS